MYNNNNVIHKYNIVDKSPQKAYNILRNTYDLLGGYNVNKEEYKHG